MIDPELRDLWVPTGLLLGFQVTLFKWRVEREAEVGDRGDIPWLAPSDYLAILGMLTLVIGVILFPLSGVNAYSIARAAFGLGTLFFIGQILGLAGHYQLYNRTASRKFVWCPLQEIIVLFLTGAIAAVYLILITLR